MTRSARIAFSLLVLGILLCASIGCGGRKAAAVKLTDFSDTVVAGSASDFMEVRHVVMRGSNYAIGHAIGEMAEKIGVRVMQPEDTLRNMVQRTYMKENYPVMYERMRGLADSYDLSLSDSRYDFSAIPQFPSGPTGCSVVYYPASSSENGHDMLSRNYDYSLGTFQGGRLQPGEPAVMSRPYVFELYPDNGYPSIAVCALDLLGGVLDGVNSEGLAVAVLAEGEAMRQVGVAPTLGIGMHELESMRYLLDNCKNVEEAKEGLLTLKHFYTAIPCHYIVGDREGRSFVFEFSPQRNGVAIVDGNGPQCVTNHLVSNYKSVDEFPKTGSTNSYDRYREIYEATKDGGKFSVEQMKAVNAGVAFRWHGGENPEYPPTRTLWHALYDLDEGSASIKFYLRDGADPSDKTKKVAEYTDYLTFKLKPSGK